MKEEHMAIMRAREEVEEISSAEVHAYLRRHPDFFLRNEDALAELQLPHRAGAAVSLVERQVTLLRERNIESRHRLSRLLETAQDNDQLFAKTRQLILALLDADSLQRLSDSVVDSMCREFGAEQCRLLLIEDQSTPWQAGGITIARDTIATTLKGMLRAGKPLIGPLRTHEIEPLFGVAAEEILSVALVPVGASQPFALLAIGSTEARRFHPEMGTLFLEFIGDALQRLLPRFRE